MEQSLFWLAMGLIVLAGYYSLVIMPKQRNFKRHQNYVASMRVGEEVITYSGIIGTITELDAEDGIAKVRLAEGVEVRMLTAAILRRYDPEEIARNAQMGLEGQKNAGHSD